MLGVHYKVVRAQRDLLFHETTLSGQLNNLKKILTGNDCSRSGLFADSVLAGNVSELRHTWTSVDGGFVQCFHEAHLEVNESWLF